MSFNWAEYLSIAEGLCGMLASGPPAGIEAQQRAAVSRAYYAAFVSARNRLRDMDGVAVPRSGNTHKFVADRYEQHDDLGHRRIGIELSRLRLSRNQCDYDDDVSRLSALTSRSLSRTAQILKDLGRL